MLLLITPSVSAWIPSLWYGGGLPIATIKLIVLNIQQ